MTPSPSRTMPEMFPRVSCAAAAEDNRTPTTKRHTTRRIALLFDWVPDTSLTPLECGCYDPAPSNPVHDTQHALHVRAAFLTGGVYRSLEWRGGAGAREALARSGLFRPVCRLRRE